MEQKIALIGRYCEQKELIRHLTALQAGQGGILLVSGEAGIGKTYLLEAVLAQHNLLVLHGLSCPSNTPPFGPICQILRAYLRKPPHSASDFGELAPHLAALLPELGPLPSQHNAELQFEAICQALLAIARQNNTVFVLEDLQWADKATLELLPELSEMLRSEPGLLVGVYRDSELGRGHGLRHLRDDLRRNHSLNELRIEAFDYEQSADLCAALLGERASPSLIEQLYQRSEGNPLFIAELIRALRKSGQLVASPAGLQVQTSASLPLPETLRDALCLQLDRLPSVTLKALQAAAVLGQHFSLDLLPSEYAEQLDLLCQAGSFVTLEKSHGRFRHSLVRELIYDDIAWGERLQLHTHFAQQIASRQAPSLDLAQHWLAARNPQAARQTFVAVADLAAGLHAYHDAYEAAQQALQLWPHASDQPERFGLLDRAAHYAQLCGNLERAKLFWRELADHYYAAGSFVACAESERRIAQALELEGDWQQALLIHTRAAKYFEQAGLLEESISELLVAASHLRSAGRFQSALELLAQARFEDNGGARPDLQARIWGLQGNLYARMGDTKLGLDLLQAALALALSHNFAPIAAEIYQRLADGLEHSGDYVAASESYSTAFAFCQHNQLDSTAQLCVACLTAVLRQTGEWDRAMTLCREILANPENSLHARTVASGVLGGLYVQRGQANRALALLSESAALAQQIELAAMELLAAWGLAFFYEQQGDYSAASERCRFMLARWREIEDVHYVIAPLRWSASFFAVQGLATDLQACTDCLAQIASRSGQPEALSALLHALGENALLAGHPDQAVRHFEQALELLRDVGVPFCYAGNQLRAGVAAIQAGQPKRALALLQDAQRTARKLGARPLLQQIAQALESIDSFKTETNSANQASHQLTPRQYEILQLVAQGLTNSQIAQKLILSPRTVEMHVGNLLALLNCRSRAEAVGRAAEQGLLQTTV
jgi:DNA-binding CsgD family transcriptional regulator